MKGTLFALVPAVFAPACVFVNGSHELAAEHLGWELVHVGPVEGAGLRGLCAPGSGVIWISGERGACAISEDFGRTWRDASPPQAQADGLDLRSIHAQDANRAWAASAGLGEASRILRTGDGGRTWETVHTNREETGFFDSIAFWDERRGIVMGDPVDGYLTILVTDDGGDTWSRVPKQRMPDPVEGEYGFAASNRSISVADPHQAWIGTGGSVARVLRSEDDGYSWVASPTSMNQGDEAAGIFAIAFADRDHGVVVGGKYTDPPGSSGNCAHSVDGGENWIEATAGPRGFRSAVAPIPGQPGTWIAVGITGTDVSLDGGKTWQPVGGRSDVELNAVVVSPSGEVAWAVGPRGRVLRMSLRAAR